MTWEEYCDKFYDWAESTRIKKLSSVDALGSADEVVEVMMELAFNHEDIVNRIARRAIDQKLIFSANNLMDISINIDPELFKQLALQSVSAFSKDDLVMLEGCVDDDVLVQLYRNKGLKVPDVFLDDERFVNPMNQDEYGVKQPSGLFSKLAMAFGIGAGIHQGINDALGRPDRKFRVGDHVRVRYRGQEGTVIDINWGLYIVSLNDGGHVDSYTENQLEKVW